MTPAIMPLIAALPMYDWPERRGEVDAEWRSIRDALQAFGVDAPACLTRRNADMPAVPGGIRDERGTLIAPDPKGLPPDDLDLPTLWRHPALVFAQTCWGPMAQGLVPHVAVIAQPDYGDVAGGSGPLYSSAIVMRRNDAPLDVDKSAVDGGPALPPLPWLSGARFAFNSSDSLSGYLALKRDLEDVGAGMALFSGLLQTGSHRASIRAVAERRADIAAIDARSWHIARRIERFADHLAVAGWTRGRLGPPFIVSRHLAHLVLPFRRRIADAHGASPAFIGCGPPLPFSYDAMSKLKLLPGQSP